MMVAINNRALIACFCMEEHGVRLLRIEFWLPASTSRRHVERRTTCRQARRFRQREQKMDSRFDELDACFDRLDACFDEMDGCLTRIEVRLEMTPSPHSTTVTTE